MKIWKVWYYIRSKNLYTTKVVYADTAQKAIKKARVKNIEDIYEIDEKGKEIVRALSSNLKG